MKKKKVVKQVKKAEIKVSAVKMVPINDIVPHPQNPNIHSEKQIEDLSLLIKEYGFDTVLVIDKKTGWLIKGEARWKAAQKLGMTQVPVSYRDFRNDGEAYAVMVADNEIGRASKTNIERVKIDMKQFKIDPNLLGMGDVGKLVDVKGHKRDPSKKNKEIDTDGFGDDLEHKCPKCGFEFSDKKEE